MNRLLKPSLNKKTEKKNKESNLKVNLERSYKLFTFAPSNGGVAQLVRASDS
jgi:hypothetical protein